MKLIEINEIVIVTPQDVRMLDGQIRKGRPAFRAKVIGYGIHRTKYKVAREMMDGRFSEHGDYYFLHEVTRAD